MRGHFTFVITSPDHAVLRCDECGRVAATLDNGLSANAALSAADWHVCPRLGDA